MEIPKEVDLFLFIGQSNMAGRGVQSKRWPQAAPQCLPGAGYEYRAVSDPTRLYPICEPFGYFENCPKGIWEPGKKSGSMVTAFVNAYFPITGIPIVGISASRGGTEIAEWMPGSLFMQDVLQRFSNAVDYLQEMNIRIQHRYMLWCQGETDGKLGNSIQYYKESFEAILSELKKVGIEHCFMVRIGHFNALAALGSPMQDYRMIMRAQEELAAENQDITMVSTSFARMRDRGLMADAYHYYQQAYNEVGIEAGINTAHFVNELKFDYEEI